MCCDYVPGEPRVKTISYTQVLSVWAGQKCRHYKLYKEEVSLLDTLLCIFYSLIAERVLFDTW